MGRAPRHLNQPEAPCPCGAPAYRASTYTGRRQVRRCSQCDRMTARCVCPKGPDHRD